MKIVTFFMLLYFFYWSELLFSYGIRLKLTYKKKATDNNIWLFYLHIYYVMHLSSSTTLQSKVQNKCHFKTYCQFHPAVKRKKKQKQFFLDGPHLITSNFKLNGVIFLLLSLLMSVHVRPSHLLRYRDIIFDWCLTKHACNYIFFTSKTLPWIATNKNIDKLIFSTVYNKVL